MLERLTKFWARCCYGEKKKPAAKTVNILFGFFLIVNLCVGTGFLGIPYAFFYGGYVAAVPTIVFISVVSWINANYLLEVMARAQVGMCARVYDLELCMGCVCAWSF